MNGRFSRILLIGLLAVLMLLPARSVSAGEDSLKDNFNDNSRNMTYWWAITGGTGPTVNERNSRLEIALPENAEGDFFFGGYLSKFKLHGDFDVYVDYYLLTWPKDSGVRIGIGTRLTKDQPIAVERVGLGKEELKEGERYITHFGSDGMKGMFTTSDNRGKLRIYRRGDLVRGYYYDLPAHGWKTMHTASISTEDMRLFFAAWSSDSVYGNQKTVIAFDNVVVRIGTLVYE